MTKRHVTPIDPETCNHKIWGISSRTVQISAFETARVRYCTGCGKEWGKYAGRQS